MARDLTDAPSIVSFSGIQVTEAQTALRGMIGLAPEQFAIEQLICMLSDEIELARERDFSDEEIAEVISKTTNKPVDAALIAKCCEPPESRCPPMETD